LGRSGPVARAPLPIAGVDLKQPSLVHVRAALADAHGGHPNRPLAKFSGNAAQLHSTAAAFESELCIAIHRTGMEAFRPAVRLSLPSCGARLR
jgi:hypothetical protein